MDQERAELKQGKRRQFIITLRDLFFVHFVLLGYHITKRISIFVALIYDLTCANLSLFGNLNKKKGERLVEKNGSLGHEPFSVSLMYHIRNIYTHIRKPGFLVHYTSMKQNSEN